jgi:hypothetical protein
MGRFSRYPAVNRSIPSSSERTWTNLQHVSTHVSENIPQKEEKGDALAEAIEEPAALPDWPSPDELAEMSIREVLDWVGKDKARSVYALDAEISLRGRKTIIKKLSEQ